MANLSETYNALVFEPKSVIVDVVRSHAFLLASLLAGLEDSMRVTQWHTSRVVTSLTMLTSIANPTAEGHRATLVRDGHNLTDHALRHANHEPSTLKAILEDLLEIANGMGANVQDVHGQTPLHWCVQHSIRESSIVSAIAESTVIGFRQNFCTHGRTSPTPALG
jgi:hypothetical protein